MPLFKQLTVLAAFGYLISSLLACTVGPGERALMCYAKAAEAYDAGNLKTAAEAARESLRAKKYFLPANVLLGKISYFMGDDETAMIALKRGLKVSPRAGEAALWLSRACRAAGKSADAKAICETLLSSDPGNIAALRLAACIAVDAGDGAAAVAYLNRAVESAGEAGLVFADRAAIRWAAGDAAGAQEDLAAALVTLPPDSAVRQAATGLLARITETAR